MSSCPAPLPTLPIPGTESAVKQLNCEGLNVPRASHRYYPPERPEPDVCPFCAQEFPGCLCPVPEHRSPSPADLERARQSRLTCAELRSIQ